MTNGLSTLQTLAFPSPAPNGLWGLHLIYGHPAAREVEFSPTESQEKGPDTTSRNRSSIYTHALNRDERGVQSRADGLAIRLPAGQPYRNYPGQP